MDEILDWGMHEQRAGKESRALRRDRSACMATPLS